MPLLFQELAIPRFPYRTPCVLWVKDLNFPAKPVKRIVTDLPYSDIEFKVFFPEVSLDLGLIN